MLRLEKAPQGFLMISRAHRGAGLGILAAAVCGLGLLGALLFGSVAELHCEGAARSCRLSSGGELQLLSLAELERAEVHTRRGSRRRDVHRAMLVRRDGTFLPLGLLADADRATHERWVEEVNAFLQQPEGNSLRLRHDTRPRAWGFGAMMLALGAALRFGLGRPTRTTLDLDRGEVAVRPALRLRAARHSLSAFSEAGLEYAAPALRRVVLRGEAQVLPVTSWLEPADDPAAAMEKLRAALVRAPDLAS